MKAELHKLVSMGTLRRMIPTGVMCRNSCAITYVCVRLSCRLFHCPMDSMNPWECNMHPVLIVTLEPGAFFPMSILGCCFRGMQLVKLCICRRAQLVAFAFFFCLRFFFPRRLMSLTVSVTFLGLLSPPVCSVCLALTLVLLSGHLHLSVP